MEETEGVFWAGTRARWCGRSEATGEGGREESHGTCLPGGARAGGPGPGDDPSEETSGVEGACAFPGLEKTQQQPKVKCAAAAVRVGVHVWRRQGATSAVWGEGHPLAGGGSRPALVRGQIALPAALVSLLLLRDDQTWG